jgi:hypothetical protein
MNFLPYGIGNLHYKCTLIIYRLLHFLGREHALSSPVSNDLEARGS